MEAINIKLSLKAARVNADLKQAEAAEKIGVSSVTLSSWELKKTFPTMGQLKRMCEIYGIEVEDLNL